MCGNFKLLPPANEVWGKVMFLYLSVSHTVRGEGGVCPITCWDTHPPGRHPQGRHPPGQTRPPPDTTGYDQQAGGTHPTGMHICLHVIKILVFLYFRTNLVMDFNPTVDFTSDSPKIRLLKKTLSISLKM